MALKDDSTTTNPSATIDAMITEMRRLVDRIEARCAGIEHSIGPILTASASASASATIYDESVIFDERPIFDKESAIDKELNINHVLTASATIYDEPLFDEGPVFDEEFDAGLIFDKEPVFDEELLFNTEPVFDVDPVFDEEFNVDPIFDEEADDSITAGYDVVLSCGPDVSTTTAGHNITARPRQASAKFCIDKEFVLDSGSSVVALNAIAAVTMDIDTPANCSTKCLGRAVIAAAAATEYTVAEKVVMAPNYAPVPSTSCTTSSKYVDISDSDKFDVTMNMESNDAAATFLLRGGMFKDVPVPRGTSEALRLKLLVNVDLKVPPLAKCLRKWPGHDTGAGIRVCFPDVALAVPLDLIVLGFSNKNLQSLNSEALLYASLSAHKVDSGKYTERQPWPPPTELRITVNGAIVRPVLWPSFIMGDMSSATWCFSWSVKPPWPPPSHKVFSYVLGCAAVFVLAGICSRTPITVHELLPWLECDLVGEVLQRKCGGTCTFFLPEGCQVENIHDDPDCQVLVAAQFHFSVSMVGIGYENMESVSGLYSEERICSFSVHIGNKLSTDGFFPRTSTMDHMAMGSRYHIA